MITEYVMAPGAWSLTLTETAPASIRDALEPWGHIVVTAAEVDPDRIDPLGVAKYAGPVLVLGNRRIVLSGAGMAFHLGDANGGDVHTTAVTLSGSSFTNAVTQLLPPGGAVTAGTLSAVAGTYTGTHQYQSPAQAIRYICDHFGGEFRVNPDGTLDVGARSDLYNTTPVAVLVRGGGGSDPTWNGAAASIGTRRDWTEWTSDVVVFGEGGGTATAIATASTGANPYTDIHGNTLVRKRMVTDASTESGNVTTRAQYYVDMLDDPIDDITIDLDDYEVEGAFVLGDDVYVYDPDSGLVDTANQVTFRGQRLHPLQTRIVGMTWAVTEGHGVYYRASDGAYVDLTRHVEFENPRVSIVVGSLEPTLTSQMQIELRDGRFHISVDSAEIGDLAVTTAKIANLAVTNAKIANATIEGGKIANAQITSSHIVNGTITGTDISSATITGSNIANTTITASNIVSGTITGTQIASATITGSNIAASTIAGSNIINGTITGTDIASTTITASNIVSGTITGTQIASATITGSNIAGTTITASNIVAGTITGTQIASATITGSNIAGTTITASNIVAGTITGTQVASATITGSNIANTTITASNIVAGTITGTEIASATITASNITGGTITATEIADATITGAKIVDATITSAKVASLAADKITAGTITSQNLNIAGTGVVKSDNYSAGSAGWQIEADGSAEFNNVTVRGELVGTSGSLSGLDVTGNITTTGSGKIRTASSGARVELSTGGIGWISGTGGTGGVSMSGSSFIMLSGSNSLTFSPFGARLVGDGFVYLRVGASDTVSVTASEVLSKGINPHADSTYDLGTTSVRWATAYIDDIVTTTSITVGGSAVSVAGHSHTESDISDLAHTPAIDDLTDVTISSVGSNEILGYSGGWINRTLAEAGISATGHGHDAGSWATQTLTTKLITPEIESTADITLDPAGGDVFVDGNLRRTGGAQGIGANAEPWGRVFALSGATSTTGTALILDTNSEIRPDSSRRAHKKNISDFTDPALVDALQPRSFTWRKEHGGHPAIGFITEEVADADPRLAGEYAPVDRGILAVLTAAVQDLRHRVTELEAS